MKLEKMLTAIAEQMSTARQQWRAWIETLIPAKVAFNEEESLTEGQIIAVKGTFNAQNISTRYAA